MPNAQKTAAVQFCLSKSRHTSLGNAKAAARWLNSVECRGRVWFAVECPNCGGWHTNSTAGKQKGDR